MLDALTRGALARPLLTVLAALLLIAVGLNAAMNLPIDAFPDVSAPQVKIIVKLPGMTPEEMETRVTTPIDFRDRLLSLKGAAFGLEPVLTQSAWFRPHNRSEELERLYLVGAGTHPGAGLPGVLSSARVLDRLVPDPSHV